jgi:regulatory protein YycI of two-component signal transduction system YycFG
MQHFAMFGYYMVVHECSCMLLLNRWVISSLYYNMGENTKVRPVMSRHAPVVVFVSLVSVSKVEAYNIYVVLVLDHPVKVSDKQAAAPPAPAWPWICL